MDIYTMLEIFKIMDWKITYTFKGEQETLLMQDTQNILGAIGQFYEDHEKGCEIIRIEEY